MTSERGKMEHNCIESALANTKLGPDDPKSGLAVRCPIDGNCWQYDMWVLGEDDLPSWKRIDPPGGVV